MRLPSPAPLVLALALGSCAGFDADRHVAPVYTEISTARGGVETEALGGAVIVRRRHPSVSDHQWGLRPLFTHTIEPDGRRRDDFLVPLGRSKRDGRELTWQLIPISRYSRVREADGRERYSFISLPGIYFAGLPDGRRVRAWFPFGGVVDGLLTFDRLEFVLFPLWVRSVRDGKRTVHFLFPIFAYTTGEGAGGWRFWPLVGHSYEEELFDRWFFLWPIVHWQRNNLKAGPGHERFEWAVLPLISRTTQEEYTATTVLWPFFGYASDPTTGFWSWDGPWPLVRIQRSGREDGVRRTRLWPLYSYYRGDGLEQRYWLWPIYHTRQERYYGVERDATYLLPFWQRWDRESEFEGHDHWEKLWPLYHREDIAGRTRFALIDLNPLWRYPLITEHWGWMWELYAVERAPDVVRERSWLGLWRRERDADEDRRSLVGLWAQRRYSRQGARVKETSLLFGLLRWRSSASDSLELMWPALPGPGWPHERVPSSLPRRAATEDEAPADRPQE